VVSSILLCGDSHLTPTSSRGTIKLGPRLEAVGWGVEHLAVGGLTTREALVRFPLQLPFGLWTLLSFGANDAAPWKQVPLGEFRESLGALIDRCRSDQVLVLPPPPVVEGSGEQTGRTNALVATYALAAREVAHAHHARVLGLVEPLALDGSHHAADGVHLNDRAYEILAQSLLAMIEAP
jgi:lysophospholipase L1-like esterase